jgi:steroid delta-isomerase-like uncharacterized protein
MTRPEINDLITRFQAAWDRRDVAMLADLHAEDGVVESPFAGGMARGRLAIRSVYENLLRTFPDFMLHADPPLIDGDRVVLITRISGTDRGGLMGMAPTGRAFDIPCVLLFDLENGLIVRERRIYDFTGLAVQVGALRAKPAV